MIESRILRWGDYPRLSRGTLNIITSALKRGGAGGDLNTQRGRKYVHRGRDWRDVGPSQGMPAPLEAGKRQEWILPWSPQREPGQMML